jgi:large subunit ribosomal protein L29
MKLRARDLRTLSEPELTKRLDEAYEELFRLRTRLAIRELDNFAEIRNTKKSIARLKTFLHQQHQQAT